MVALSSKPSYGWHAVGTTLLTTSSPDLFYKSIWLGSFSFHYYGWKGKKGIIHFLLLDIKWEVNKKTLKNRVFLRHFLSTQKSLKLLFKNVFFLRHFTKKNYKKFEQPIIWWKNMFPAMCDIRGWNRGTCSAISHCRPHRNFWAK